MNHSVKYDVAISFSEEDHSVAAEIAEALKEIGISYYLYSENIAIHWGEHLFNITYKTYADRSRYVLLIISKTYIQKKWTNIEQLIIQSSSNKASGNILPLRVDDTHVDGLSSSIVFVKWNNDPKHIAALIKEKLIFGTKSKKLKSSYKLYSTLCLLIFIAGLICLPGDAGNDKLKQNSGIVPDHEKKPRTYTDTNNNTTSFKPAEKKEEAIKNARIPNSNAEKIDKKDSIVYQYDYCITVSGNNSTLNQSVTSLSISLLHSRNLTVSNICQNASKTLKIFLKEITTQSETVTTIVSSSCNYTIDIIQNKTGAMVSEAGRVNTPGFSQLANMNTLSDEIIKKLNTLL